MVEHVNKPANAVEEPQPLLEIRNVTKSFDGVAAVDDVSLTINKGEIFALLGASGCGKSTLLRMLAGFERPTKGSIILDGQDMANIPPYKRPVNMMFQSYALFPHMTVEQNIAFGLKQDGLPKAEVEARVQEMLGLVHMETFARRKPHQLSGGQRQRVALARSLASSSACGRLSRICSCTAACTAPSTAMAVSRSAISGAMASHSRSRLASSWSSRA